MTPAEVIPSQEYTVMPGSAKIARRQFLPTLFPTLLGLSFLLAGCLAGTADNPFVAGGNTDRFILRAESRNYLDVSVYITTGGKRELLGTVSPRGLEFFEFEYPSGRPLTVELENRVGDRYRVPPPSLAGGGRLDLYISNNLRNSRFQR